MLHPYERRKPAPVSSVNVDYLNQDNGIYHYCLICTACESLREKFNILSVQFALLHLIETLLPKGVEGLQ